MVDPAASAPAALHDGGAVGADARSGRRFLTVRAAIVGDDTVSAAERRSALVELSDAWLATLFDALPPASTIGMSLVAVGGYGRRELLPCSDLDVLLLHADGGDVAAVANGVFYPVWDSGVALDHAVRTVAEARAVAADDLAVALGLVDARHVAGDPKVTESLRTGVLRDWRRQAAVRLPKLAQAGRDRLAEVGELAHLLEPDLKQAYGGLRDIVALRAVAASWVADRPHAHAVSEAHEWLLVVRDALHRTTGRRHDRLVFEDQDTVAASLGLLDADALMRRVAEAGRAIAYATDVTWRQVERTLRARSSPARSRRPVSRRSLGHGVVEHDGEAVLARDARPELDPVVPLRAAAGAAQAGLVLSPATVERLAIECPPLPPVWPDAARDALVALLGAGKAAVPVWDSLEAAGLIVRWFPEWEPVRYRPQRTPVHRHTVDRHQVEAAVVAAGLTRRVSRPDLLLLAALFHDLGKGGPGDHSDTGAAIVTELGGRLGLSLVDAQRLGLLVRHHLLLPAMATRRDLDDPTTIDAVARACGSVEVLDLLAALTEADATAAGPLAWSPMRARLVAELVTRARLVLGGKRFRKPPALEPAQKELAQSTTLAVRMDLPGEPDGSCRVTVVVPGRADALAPVAGVLAVHRLDVRAATIQTAGGRAVQVWHASTGFRGPPGADVLRTDIARALDGGVDLAAKLRARAGERRRRVVAHADPHVEVLPGASADAALIVFVQPDLGTALVYGAVTLAILFVSGTPWQHFAALGGIALAAVAAVLLIAPAVGHPVLHGYQFDRLTSFLHPSDDPAESSYQTNQALIAIGSGGKLGRGDDATQTQHDFLPENQTDFVFSAIAERWGFAGAALLLSLYALLIWRALRITTLSKNLYGSLVGAGIAAMLLFQVFVNVGMNVGLMPVAGIPLPLMSYGGTSVLVTFMAIGVLQSIYVQSQLSSPGRLRTAQ